MRRIRSFNPKIFIRKKEAIISMEFSWLFDTLLRSSNYTIVLCVVTTATRKKLTKEAVTITVTNLGRGPVVDPFAIRN